jgi:major membrane immunogen (membrane-anchored lipoprotein)
MKTLFNVTIVLVFLLTACGPSQEEMRSTVQVAIAQTQNAVPTSTIISPTLSLVEVKLDPEIFQVEDLGLVGGAVSEEIPQKYYFGIPNGVNQLTREMLSKEGNHYSGFVTIVIYDSPTRAEALFNGQKTKLKGKTEDENIFTYEESTFSGAMYYQDSLLIVADVGSQNIEPSSIVYYVKSLAERVYKKLTP